ncbi:hypothetical protein J505_1160 [Acinetobacter baumannii 1297549]|nr:hypothetical protein J505_1160 [Acinetobacter baumannii 1297549]
MCTPLLSDAILSAVVNASNSYIVKQVITETTFDKYLYMHLGS